MKIALLALFIALFFHSAYAQSGPTDIFSGDDDDLNIGGDIFNDFSEDIEDAQVVEDQRFFRYGRFFAFNLSLGLTTFDGVRGEAYEAEPPTYGIGFTFFKDFQSAFNLGVEYSKHHFILNDPTIGYPGGCGTTTPSDCAVGKGIGMVESNLTRVHFGYRYYIDTANLGTAITFSNPYLAARMEYWYQTLKFTDQDDIDNDSRGGMGLGVGFGLEFPVQIKETYIGFQMLVHFVNFPDRFTTNYRPHPSVSGGTGYENMDGRAYSTMVSYIYSW